MNVTRTFSLPYEIVEKLDNFVSANPSEKKGKLVAEGILISIKKRTEKMNPKNPKK